MLLVVKRGREREVEEIFEKWDLHAAHIGEVTDDGLMSVRERGAVVAEIPTGALTDDAPVYKRPMQTPAYLDGGPEADACPTRPAMSEADALARAARVACHREQTLGVPAVRPHGAHQHARAARHGRGRRAREGHQSRAGVVGGRKRPLLLPRPVSRRDARGCRSRAQRRVRRRRADWRDQLPELRQSRAAGDHVAVRARGRRHLPPRAWRWRFRLPAATSASTTRPTARRSIPLRCSAWSACSKTRARCWAASSGRAATRLCCWARRATSWAAAST